MSLVLVLVGSNAFAEEWYFAHIGKETCVPIDDFNLATMQRFYYHTGKMHTPQDVRQEFIRMGFSVEDQTAPIPNKTLLFQAKSATTGSINILLFNDERFCSFAMSRMRP